MPFCKSGGNGLHNVNYFGLTPIPFFDASDVALATEVTVAPSGGASLGTDVLTFEPGATGFGSRFTLTLLESSDFVFQSAGTRLGLEPSSSSQEDFRQDIGGVGTYAMAMILEEHQSTRSVWEFFDAGGNSLGSWALPAGGAGTIFYGVVGDVPITYATLTHDANENFGIGTQFFTLPDTSSFVSWIGGFPGAASDTSLTGDPDGDGKENGIEKFFGTNPGIADNSGLEALKGNFVVSNAFTFTHPEGAPADDLTAGYRWSTDLLTFHADGDPNGAGTTTVSFAQAPPVDGLITVTATITGPVIPERLFVDVVVMQN